MFKRIRRWLERLPKGIGHVFYWIRTHTYNKYHLIDIRGMDGYEWGWIDRDHAMMLACFKLLCDYVEKESHQVGWDWCEDAIKSKETIDYLYKWWKEDRPMKQKEIDDLYDTLPQ